MQWSLRASTTWKHILSLEQEVLAVVNEGEDFYNSTEWLISLARQLGHKWNIDNFHRKLTLRLARKFPRWKYFVYPIKTPHAHQYLQEWKELPLKEKISLTHYIYYRYYGGEKEKVAPIFPLDTFFERLGDLDEHQTYLWLRCLWRNMKSVQRYQKIGTLSDWTLDRAFSLDNPANRIAWKIASDMPWPVLLAEWDELERTIRSLPDEIATPLMQIITSDDEMTPKELNRIKAFFRKNPDQWKLFRELLQPG